MKHLSLFLVVIAMCFSASAQSFELLNTQLTDTFYYKLDGFSMDGYAYIKNNSQDTIYLDATRVVNDTASGHTTNFCFGITCYDPDVNFSVIPLAIPPGVTDTTYKLTLNHLGTPGETYVEMRISDPATNDAVLHKLYFLEDPTSSVENSLADLGYSFSLAGANPVSEIAKFNVEMPAGAVANVVVTDLSGRSLTQQTVSQTGTVELSLAGMATGIYMARLEVNGQALTAIKLVKE